MAKQVIRREVHYSKTTSELIRAKARRIGLLYKGDGNEKAYIELLIRKDLKKSTRVQGQLKL